eukprot:g6449.t1
MQTNGSLLFTRSTVLTFLRRFVHFVGAPYYVFLFLWHLVSPQARRLQGYYSYGWFYVYLTFWTFNVQCLQLCMAFVVDFIPSMASLEWRTTTGHLGCLVVSAASTVTTMYYALRILAPGGLDDPRTRVVWVSTTLHVGNSILAWSDVLLSQPREFTSFDRGLVLLYTFCYSTWLLFLRIRTGAFPYPFLNQLNMFLGWLVVVLVGGALMLLYFYLAMVLKGVFDQYIALKED